MNIVYVCPMMHLLPGHMPFVVASPAKQALGLSELMIMPAMEGCMLHITVIFCNVYVSQCLMLLFLCGLSN